MPKRYTDIDKLIKAVEDLPDCPNGYSDTYDKATIIGLIEEQPTEPRWIPVEDRLPEVGKRVLVTIPLVNGYPWVGIAWYGTPMYEDKVCFYVADSEWGDYEIREVTAWMPLPKGYERSEDAES